MNEKTCLKVAINSPFTSTAKIARPKLGSSVRIPKRVYALGRDAPTKTLLEYGPRIEMVRNVGFEERVLVALGGVLVSWLGQDTVFVTVH